MSSQLVVHGHYWRSDRVTQAAEKRWLEIFERLAPALKPAIDKLNRHVPCPVHGGTDGFRLKRDSVINGFSVCNTCGSNATGISTLMWVNGWDFTTAKDEVARFLGLEPDVREEDRRANREAREAANAAQPKSVKSVAAKPAIETSQSKAPSLSYADLDDIPFDEVRPGGIFPNAEQESAKSNVVSMLPSLERNALISAEGSDGSYKPAPPSKERMDQIRAIQEQALSRVSTDLAGARSKIERVWSESLPITNGLYSPMRDYLNNRKVLLGRDALTAGDSLRFHPALDYWHEDENGKLKKLGKHPAIIAAVRNNEGEIITLHRTYLTKTGRKAIVPEPRKMMTPAVSDMPSCAIQLGGMPTDGVLGIAEGIETALSPMAIYRIPTWSAVSATILEKFVPPEGVHTLLIWEDKDRSGRGSQASQALRDKLKGTGINVFILTPPGAIKPRKKGIDWNDVLVEDGAMGFPHWQLIRRMIEGEQSLAR